MSKVFVSTAEVSAERHASNLVRELLKIEPGTTVNVAGGDVLVQAGANLVVNMTGKAVMGFWEAVSHLSFYRWAENRILDTLAKERHDALVLVDAASFHLHLAKKVRARWPDLPILFYIAPKLWAWKEWRIENLKRDITRTMCIFPFEVPFFQERGVDAVFVGNPTLDQIRTVDESALTRLLGVEHVRRHSDPAHGVLAVFPGSRGSELKYHWPVMVETIGLLRRRFPDLKVAVGLAPGLKQDGLATYGPMPDGVHYHSGDSQELLKASSAVLAKSGTTTLEAALLGTPMAVCYAAHAASYYIAKYFVKIPYVSLPNILAGKQLVREFIQHDATPENLYEEIGRLLSDQRYYKRMRAKLRALRETLGDEYASVRAAREVASYLP
ncbi:MAG: lipid-A-disaccharide synthase [Planctomycetes bacterium]|nr:lipid-A-disaccharide synthase [Planctomycetota bacterium]